ncbi:MAG: ABC transporter substrate-binding protein [Rhodocyclaceae bacterium]|nr:ABC transporter substrate-binding protein [Rhodocyclaceae bacterium]
MLTVQLGDRKRATLEKIWVAAFFLASGGLIVVAFILFEEKPPLRIGAHHWPGYETLFYARENGWLDERRVRLIDTPSATDTMRAFQQQRLDAAALTLDEAVRLAAVSREAIAVILVFNFSLGADVVLARPAFADGRTLKGQRIGVETTGVGLLMLAHFLKAHGLGIDEVVIEPLTADRHEAAWKNGHLAALVSYEPYGSRLEKLGAVRIFDSRACGHCIVDVLVARASALERHEAALRIVAQAHFRALDEFRRNRADASFRLSKYLGVSANETDQIYRLLRQPTVEENHLLLAGKGSPLWQTSMEISQALKSFDIVSEEWPKQNLRLSAAFLPQ